MASEMLYPIMPIYLQQIGFSILLIGILEGFAEAIAGLSKGYFGKRSDHAGRRVPFVQVGYALSAISKPMMALFIYPLWIFFARTVDRIGKGIRTGARDALLSDQATAENKGMIFGFHRSMDTLGAVIGPLLALIFLYFNPEQYKTLFFIAFIPGVIAILATRLLKDDPKRQKKETKSLPFFSFLNYWKEGPVAYRKLLIGLLGFALINSSDVFLLLKAKEAGLDDTWVIGIYIFYNLVYAIFAFPFGILADKFGLKKMFLLGLSAFSAVYLGMAFGSGLYLIAACFFVYGIYAAATEGISKAWISRISAKEDTATAIGTYSAFQSIAALIASSLAGFIWFTWGAYWVFLFSGIGALIIAIYLLSNVKELKG